MRKISVLFFSLMLVSSVYSQVIMDENFNYPAGDSLGAHGWVSFSGNTNILTVVSPGLTFTGYVNSGIGNATRVRNNGYDAYKQFPPDSVGNVYVAFMVKIDSAATGDYFLALLPTTSTTIYVPRVYAKDDGGSIAFGISKGASSGGPIVYGANGFQYGTTYLVIVKYSFLSGTADDETRLYVFSSSIPGTEPSPYVGPVTGTSGDAANIARVALRQGSSSSSPTLNIDGIRVFKTWSNLVSVKPISEVAENFTLSQNYPNPFNPSTNIQFSMPENGLVTMKIYNLLGQTVKEVINEKLSRGTYEYNFDGTGLSSGIYMYKIEVNGVSGKTYSDIKRMSLVK